jgi:hypothetical protein
MGVEVKDQGIKDLSGMTAEDDIGGLRLGEAYRSFVKDEEAGIPVQVWLLENPSSPIALPGSVNLYGHDCIHLLLNRGMSNFDEAFVIGFTMGNCERVEERHLSIFKLFSRFFYPSVFRFRELHLRAFDLGVMYGRKLEYKNIHLEDFDLYIDLKIKDLRHKFGILQDELSTLWKAERIISKVV